MGKTLWLCATDTVATLYEEDYRHLCTHLRALRPGQRVTVMDQLPPNARTFFERDRQWCLKQATAIGPRCAELVALLLGDRTVRSIFATGADQQSLIASETPAAYGRARFARSAAELFGTDPAALH